MEINKIKLYERIIGIFSLIGFGAALNFIAIKANNVWMPVNTPDVKFYLLTDIIPMFGVYGSAGDMFIFLGMILSVVSFLDAMEGGFNASS